MSSNEHLWNQSQELVQRLKANLNFRQELLSSPKSALAAVGLPGGFQDSDLGGKSDVVGVTCRDQTCLGAVS